MDRHAGHAARDKPSLPRCRMAFAGLTGHSRQQFPQRRMSRVWCPASSLPSPLRLQPLLFGALRLQSADTVQFPSGGRHGSARNPADADAADPHHRHCQRPVHADGSGGHRGGLRSGARRHRLPHPAGAGAAGNIDLDGAHFRHHPVHRRHLAACPPGLHLRWAARQRFSAVTPARGNQWFHCACAFTEWISRWFCNSSGRNLPAP